MDFVICASLASVASCDCENGVEYMIYDVARLYFVFIGRHRTCVDRLKLSPTSKIYGLKGAMQAYV